MIQIGQAHLWIDVVIQDALFIGNDLISCKSKKHGEAKYQAMALETCELIWLKHLRQELRFGKNELMKLIVIIK